MKSALVALALLLMTAPALAAKGGNGNGNNGNGNGNGGPVVGAPLPLAGGISAAVLLGVAFGGAQLLRRREPK